MPSILHQVYRRKQGGKKDTIERQQHELGAQNPKNRTGKTRRRMSANRVGIACSGKGEPGSCLLSSHSWIPWYTFAKALAVALHKPAIPGLGKLSMTMVAFRKSSSAIVTTTGGMAVVIHQHRSGFRLNKLPVGKGRSVEQVFPILLRIETTKQCPDIIYTRWKGERRRITNITIIYHIPKTPEAIDRNYTRYHFKNR